MRCASHGEASAYERFTRSGSASSRGGDVAIERARDKMLPRALRGAHGDIRRVVYVMLRDAALMILRSAARCSADVFAANSNHHARDTTAMARVTILHRWLLMMCYGS